MPTTPLTQKFGHTRGPCRLGMRKPSYGQPSDIQLPVPELQRSFCRRHARSAQNLNFYGASSSVEYTLSTCPIFRDHLTLW